MACWLIPTPGGHAIVCGSGARRKCKTHGRTAQFECDWKTSPGRTCSALLCPSCATSPAPDKHLCPTHANEWSTHSKNPERSNG